MVHSQSINDYVFGMGHGARAQDGHGSIHAPRTRPDAWRGGALPPRGGHTAHTVARIGHLSHITCARSLLHTCVWHNPRQITLCDYTPTISFFFGKRGLFSMNQRHTGTRAEPQCAQSRQSTHAAAHHTRHTVRQWKTRQKRVTSTWCGKDSVQTVRGEDSAQESRFWSGLARL